MRILIVDLSSVFWTIAHAGSYSDGNVPRDYTLRDIRECGQYDRVVIAIDGDDRASDWPQIPWRRSIWPSYKANREERAQHLWIALRETIAHCEAEGYIVIRSPAKMEPNPNDDGRTMASVGQYEADDVIGSVVAWARKNGHACDIRTNDSDLTQCVRDDEPPVRLLRKLKGQKSAIDATAVKEWVGVPPHIVASLKAIAGDTGDGYGGKDGLYPGIGEKTAIELLRASNGKAREAIERAIVSEEKNADGKTIPRHIKICREIGPSNADKGLLLARVAIDVPIDFAQIETPPTPKQPPSMPKAQGPEVSDAEFEEVNKSVIADRDRRNNSTALAIVEPPRMTLAPAELVQRDREIYALIKFALKNGPPDGVNDYGIIPGCGNKPALYDVGAERLAKVFAIYPKFKTLEKEVRLFGQDPFVMFLVRCRLYLVGSNNQVGETNAACNSNEKTFRRRDGSAAPIFDLVHPVYARAQKRAFVKAILRATGAQKYMSSGFDDLVDAEFGEYPAAPQWAQQ